MRYSEVDPENFVRPALGEPANGRGAWTREGIVSDYRYHFTPDPAARVGRSAERSLAHWAVGAGVAAIQKRLLALGHLGRLDEDRDGVYDRRTMRAVKRFQRQHVDPDGEAELIADGIVGRSDARALFTPMVMEAEARHAIPGRLLLGQTAHESALDPGAVGYFIYYNAGADYRGVDRGFSQINSRAHADISWLEAFDPAYALDYSANRLRATFNAYRRDFSERSLAVTWDAAVCAHNSPANGLAWMRAGEAPSEQAASYVAAVKNAIF